VGMSEISEGFVYARSCACAPRTPLLSLRMLLTGPLGRSAFLATQRAFAASVVLAHGVRWSSQWRGGFEIGGEKFGFPPPLASFSPVSVSSSCPLRVCVCYAWAWHAGRSWLSRHRFFSRPSPVMGLSLVLVVAQRRVLVRELGELVGGVAVDGQPRKTCSTSVATGAAVLCEPTYGVEYDGQSMVVCSTSVATGAAVLCTSTEWRCVRRPVGACSAACIGTRADLWRCIQRPVGRVAQRCAVVARGLGELVGGVAFDGHPTMALSGTRFCLCTSVCCVHRQIRDRHPLRRRLGGGV